MRYPTDDYDGWDLDDYEDDWDDDYFDEDDEFEDD